MLAWLTGRSLQRRKARQLYGAVVAQARHPDLYRIFGAQDTTEGRYEMIALHMFLLLERLGRDGARTAELSRLVAEAFVADMDIQLREMGVGDLSVPRKVKRAAAGLFERSAQYRRALSAPDPLVLERFLTEILSADAAGVDPGAAGRADTRGFAAYIRRAAADLAEQPLPELAQGRVRFGPPAIDTGRPA